jgi:hypothetical protein
LGKYEAHVGFSTVVEYGADDMVLPENIGLETDADTAPTEEIVFDDG